MWTFCGLIVRALAKRIWDIAVDFFMGPTFADMPAHAHRIGDLPPDEGKAVFDRAMIAAGEAGKRADA